ncbi:MAG TPA: hypothetical protein VH107_16350 [Lacipirellulaceae bacterium]|jgi:hypothetical protein|nr:hypothetical protein [Lacipirellulaceae bacterium]
MALSRRRLILGAWLLGYVALVAAIVITMFHERTSVLNEYSTQPERAAWRNWREDEKQRQTNPGPVIRKVPKSEEPPALVLMRDYFKISLFGATFFTSLLYWIMAWFVTGAFSTSTK